MDFTVTATNSDVRMYDGDSTYSVLDNGALSIYDPDAGEKITYGPSGWLTVVETEDEG